MATRDTRFVKVVSAFAVVAAILVLRVSALTDPTLPNIFYPFGLDVGDRVLPISDDGFSQPIAINISFPFFNTSHSKVFVHTNGALSFDKGVLAYIPDQFPIANVSLVAPYWTDVDTTVNKGRVYYRTSTDSALIDRAASDIQSAFSSQGFYFFNPRWLFIATWHNVTFYGGDTTSPFQTFQAVLATDGIHSFALFNYGNLTWTQGVSSIVHAQVGFNLGDNVTFYSAPWSRTFAITNICQSSNIGVTGRWSFRIDNARAVPPGCTKSAGAGSDCDVSASTIPTIIQNLDGPECDVRTRLCQSVLLVLANSTTNVTCKVLLLLSNGQIDSTFYFPTTLQSRTTFLCPLPTPPLSQFSSRANFTAIHGAGFDFNDLPRGSGGLLTYSVSVSNDGLSYSGERTLTVFDSVCFSCVSNGCTRNPNTCVIRGYCFASGAANPYNKCYACSPCQKQNLWKLTGKKKKCCKKHKKCRSFV